MINKKRKIIASICAAAIIGAAVTPNVSAGYLGWDLVDSGKHLDYDGNSAYMSSITSGVSTWNAYKSGVIRKDGLTVTEDVYISDYNEVSSTMGVTSSRGTIKFNTYHFATMTTAQRQKTATHELGHALGLDHTTGTSDIMKQGKMTITALSATDKSSYDTCYTNY